MTILSLPSDILIIIIQNVSVGELCALSITCRLFYALVSEFGWGAYLRANSRQSFSLSKARSVWDPRHTVQYDILTERSWARAEFVARPLARPWLGKLQPLLAFSPSRLVVSAGSHLYSYKFGVPSRDGESPPVYFEGSCSLLERRENRRDITGVAFIADGGLDRTLMIGFDDGVLENIYMIPPSKNSQSLTVERHLPGALQLHRGELIECIRSEGNMILTLSSGGIASISDLSFQSPSTLVDLQNRSWTSYFRMQSSTPFAAFGTSSVTPLTVHSITHTELCSSPSAVLYAHAGHLANNNRSSAVYGITSAPPSSPWGPSDQIIVSGWYDGCVRVHDLRSSTRSQQDAAGPAALLPVLSLYDPWSFEPIYDVSCGGGASSHIAAGTARHGVVSFWDVRFPQLGWSVHAPGNDASPVYSLFLESSRLFGVTQSRPFVYDFGPGVTSDTYPPLPLNPGTDGLKQKRGFNGISYYVSKYYHNRSNTNQLH